MHKITTLPIITSLFSLSVLAKPIEHSSLDTIQQLLPSGTTIALDECKMSIKQDGHRSSLFGVVWFRLQEIDSSKIKKNNNFNYGAVALSCLDDRECISVRSTESKLEHTTSSYVLKTSKATEVANRLSKIAKTCR